jgi:cysteine desulfurase/selenocysteine lyase
VYQFGDRVSQALEASRETVRALLNAAAVEEIIFTSGTTMSINLVANAWGRKFLKAGDEVLVTEMEHHANLVPWQQIVREKGGRLRYIPITSDGRLDLDRIDDVLTDRTRLLAVTGMSNVLGTINPIGELVRRAKQVGALVLVDAAQSVPHGTLDVRDPAVDFLAFSGHKLYGPTGIGILYGRRELLEAMDPFLCGGHMIERVEREQSTWAELPAKFEAGTIPIAEAIALKAAIEYVQQLDFSAIASHEHALTQYAHERLSEIPGLRIYGPAVEHKGSIVSFTIDRVAAEDLAVLLDLKGVFVRHGHHCTMPLHAVLGVPATVRASFGLYNTPADVDALVDAIHFARKKLRLE